MPEKPRARPLSASRQRRHSHRRSSLNGEMRASETTIDLPPSPVIISGVDYRPLKEKITELQRKFEQQKDDSTSDEHLQSLVLMQLYTSLEYGEVSTENAQACLNLTKYYLDQQNLLPQANTHLMHARQILEQFQPLEEHLSRNFLAFDIYLHSIKCALQAKQHLSQRDPKLKNKHVQAIDTTRISRDLELMDEHLAKIQHLTSSKDYDQKRMEYLMIRFDLITNNLKEFDETVHKLVGEIIEHIDKYPSDDRIARKIDVYLRLGFYLVHDDRSVPKSFEAYQKAVQLAEEQEQTTDQHRHQLANVMFQWGKARVRIERLTDKTERKFQRAIELYRTTDGQLDLEGLKVIDELATFYTKLDKYQEALNVLCDSLPDKQRVFGDFSDEVIQTRSRIGAIYLRECEYLNAAEHFTECLDLQEFVYGPKDHRTCQTRDALQILKKDPHVSRAFFSHTQDGLRQDRPAFKMSNRVSHDKADHQLLLPVTKKPPIGSKNSN